MKKRIMSLTMATMLSVSLLAGCGEADQSKANEVQQKVETPATVADAPVDFKGESPALVTSFGQSADAAMLKAIMGKTGVEFDYNNLADADELGSAKTMIVAVGASSKGLGAAGIKPEEELDRAKKVVEKAKANGMKIVVAHLGGESRRGKLSDKFIDVGLSKADYVIVVDTGNHDGKFTDFAKEKNIPITIVSSIAKTTEPLANIFK